ncbi:MAG TPA: MFS transporter [Woeseiaceae bacterium]|nr:MFS transporter [Woeseiaceae bacterium]
MIEEPASPGIAAAVVPVALSPAERRAVTLLTAVSMLRMLGLFSLLPVLSVYAAGLDGATPLLIGLAVGAYGLTQAGLQLPLGALSDRVGRKPVIVGGLVVFAAGCAVAATSDTVAGVIAGRLLQGAGAIAATLTALLADTTRAVVRTRAMAVLGIGIGASFVVAMVFGPWFAAHFGVPALFGFGIVAAVLACGMLLAVPAGPPAPRASGELRRALRPDLLRIDTYVFLLHAILTASFVALPFVLGTRLALPVTSHWQLYVGAIAVSLAGTIPLILADERRGRGRTLALAVSCILAGELLLAFAAFATVSVFVALSLFFAGFNFLEASLPARLSTLADANARGASLGVYSSAQFLGAFAGGLLGGRLISDGSSAAVFFACALLAGIWLAILGFSRR